jgi:hypothetical protein
MTERPRVYPPAIGHVRAAARMPALSVAEANCAHAETRIAADPRWLGPSRRPRMERDRPGRGAELAPAAGRMPAHADRHARRARRPARWADGQFRGRAHEHRCRARRLPGADAHRPGHPRWQLRRKSGVYVRVRWRAIQWRHPARVRVAVAGRRAFARGACARLSRRRSGRGPEVHRRACLHRRPRYAAEKCGCVVAGAAGEMCGAARRAHRQRDRSLLRDGSRQPLGAGRTRVSRDHRGERGVPCRGRAGRARSRLRARRERRVRAADRDRRRREAS